MVTRLYILTAALAALLAGTEARATTFTVTNTNDAGAGSLRAALLAANAQQITGGTSCAPHDIQFLIPGDAPHTIQPLSPLPSIQIQMSIDAFSQPGSSPNTLTLGYNGIPGIELDGSLAGPADAIVIEPFVSGSSVCGGNGSIIRGFAINRFAGSAISAGADACTFIQGCSTVSLTFVGNLIGTDVTGLLPRGNGIPLARPGIRIGNFSAAIIIGDRTFVDGGPVIPLPGNRNVISANGGGGGTIRAFAPFSFAADIRVRNNYIGLAADGVTAMGNIGDGVLVGMNATGTRVNDNLISANAGSGVRIVDNRGTAVLEANGIGIGLGGTAHGNAGFGVSVSNSDGVSVARRFAAGDPAKPSIANNGFAGIYVEFDSILNVDAVQVGDNGGLGIDLAPLGVNVNDQEDPDGGANEGLNYPELTSATYNSTTSQANIQGRLNSTPNSTIEVYFYISTTCDGSGHGEGENFVADPLGGPLFQSVTTNAFGGGDINVNTTFLPVGRLVTAHARRFNTTAPFLEVSEFSRCRQVTSTGPFIFDDGFE